MFSKCQPNYFFDLDKRVTDIVKQSIDLLLSLNIPISNSIYFGFNCGYSYFGRTHYKSKAKKCYGYEFYVTVNKFLLNDNDVFNTVIHELLHTVPHAMHHHGAWRKYADIINQNTKHHITVYAKCALNNQAYKRKKAFDIKDYDSLTMDIVQCPVCKRQFCLRKGLKRTRDCKSIYLCSKCRCNLVYLTDQA